MDIDDDVTDEVVAHVARLARIRLDDDEAQHLQDDLGRLLEHFQELEAIDTDGVEPTFHTVDAAPLRDDEPRREVDAETLHESAPRWADRGFVVPKVLD